MSELEQKIKDLQLKRWKLLRDIASIAWKKRNPEHVQEYQKKYRKEHAAELAEKARLKRKEKGAEINARRRELRRLKNNV